MKTGAVQSVKFLRLKRALKLCHWQAVGVLESLWLITQVNAPRGDIGRLSNEDIAAMLEWPGDADELVDGLVACGWLDRSAEHRLVVHDWATHCPSYIRGSLTSQGVCFAAEQPKSEESLAPPLSPTSKPLAKPTPKPPGLAPGLSPPLPNLTKPNLTEPNQIPVRSGGRPVPPDGEISFEDDFRSWPELAELAAQPGYQIPESAGQLSQRGIFAPLRDRHLSEPRSMREWLVRQAAAPRPLLTACPQSLVAVLALAEHCKSIPERKITKSRIAVFINLASRNRWSSCRQFVAAALETYASLQADIQTVEEPELCRSG